MSGTLEELLEDEIVQRREEGCDVAVFAEELARAKGDEAALRSLYERLMALPVRPDFPYVEPSDLEGIRAERPPGPRRMPLTLSDEELYDRIYGAWLGRCAGCALGKPVEMWSAESIRTYLEGVGAYPLGNYIPERSVDEEGNPLQAGCVPSTLGNIRYMERDDDLDYTIIGLKVIEERGLAFTTEDMGSHWLDSFPYLRVYTAERRAYLNLVNELPLHLIPFHLNPYREWIGARIRADLWGYVTPGWPELGAELAHRDAALSHAKNGIYGEMFVSAMLSAAFVTSDIEEIIEMGLSEIPQRSRLAEAVRDTLAWVEESPQWGDTLAKVMAKYGDYSPVHTINNTAIVLLGLLYGRSDLEQTICISVMCGMDTDCNGATTGSIVGAMRGVGNLPPKWIEPLSDRLLSLVPGFHDNKISDLARRTLTVARQIRLR